MTNSGKTSRGPALGRGPTVEKHCFKIPHNNMYCTNHPDGTAHAGTAVIIKQTISHYELPKYEDFLQATSIRVRTLPYELTVSAVYSPPKYNLNKNSLRIVLQHTGPKIHGRRRL